MLATQAIAAPVHDNGIQDRRSAGQEDVHPAATPEQIRRAQRALGELGLYEGAIDGKMGPATRASVAAFAEAIGRSDPVRLTEALLTLIEHSADTGRLLSNLGRIREAEREEARRLLLSRADTHDLVAATGAPLAPSPAEACSAGTGVGCLLARALAAARAITDPARRDWAYTEILTAQARVGQAGAARRTVAALADPRLQLAALRRLAEIHAERGRADLALREAERIADPELRAETLAAIADRVAGGPDGDAAVVRLRAAARAVADPVTAIAVRSRLAVALARQGRHAEAEEGLAEAELKARQLAASERRRTALRHVATAWADLRHPARALSLIQAGDADGMTPILVASAGAEARSGRSTPAIAVADTIAEARYRALALAEIAEAQAAAGDLAASRETLRRGLATAREVRLPYARAEAIAQVLLAQLAVVRAAGGVGLEAVEKRSAEVTDPSRRAAVLWAVAAEWAPIDPAAADRAAAAARRATERMIGRVQRVWMFSNLAEREAAEGRGDGAERALNRALAEAEAIDTPWSRSRAYARLATASHAVQSVSPSR